MFSSYRSVFRAGLFSGQCVIVTGGFLVARECYTQWMKNAGGGAVPNAKRKVSNQHPTLAFDGSHLASKPRVLG